MEQGFQIFPMKERLHRKRCITWNEPRGLIPDRIFNELSPCSVGLFIQADDLENKTKQTTKRDQWKQIDLNFRNIIQVQFQMTEAFWRESRIRMKWGKPFHCCLKNRQNTRNSLINKNVNYCSSNSKILKCSFDAVMITRQFVQINT